MYKIGIDARLYGQTGVGVYLRNLLHYMESINDDDFLFFVYLMSEDYEKITFKSPHFVKKYANFSWHTISEQTGYVKKLYDDSLDLVHFTYFSYPVLYRKKFMSTIHDVTPLLFKTGKASTRNKLLYGLKYQAFKFVINQQIRNAKAIITPTEYVKRQIENIFGTKYGDKIYPIYEGINFELINSKIKFPNSKQLSDIMLKIKNYPFFIYVGNFYPHKNVERLVEAFANLSTESKLILIGPDDYFAERLLHLINKLKNNDKIIFYHNPSISDLIYFYKHASALVHPSLSEGFGLPLAEAAYFNLPVIASNIDVFKELLGDRYIPFDPKNTNLIAEKIKLFLDKRTDFDYSEILAKLSFKEMVRKTLDLYRDVLRLNQR